MHTYIYVYVYIYIYGHYIHECVTNLSFQLVTHATQWVLLMCAPDCAGGIHACMPFTIHICATHCAWVIHLRATHYAGVFHMCVMYSSHSYVGHAFIHVWATHSTCIIFICGPLIQLAWVFIWGPLIQRKRTFVSGPNSYVHEWAASNGWLKFICGPLIQRAWVWVVIHMYVCMDVCMFMGATHSTHMRVGRTNAHGMYMKESWHGTQMNELRTPYELVECIRMSHIWMSHEPVCHTW